MTANNALAGSERHHMEIPWHDVAALEDVPVCEASVADRCALVCRVGLLTLSGGTGSWRVREAMNRVARRLHVTCVVDVSLLGVECTCTEGSESSTLVAGLHTAGVNTERIWAMDELVKYMESPVGANITVGDLHRRMDEIEQRPANYSFWQAGLASACACAAFVFLLGGGPVEMGCAFAGAGVGHCLRRVMLARRINQLTSCAAGVAASCITYLVALMLLGLVMPSAMDHEEGYIGAMLFVIPGFPLITSGLDIAKLDMRSGLERLAYALAIIIVGTLSGWLVASFTPLSPDEFTPLGLSWQALFALRLLMSFVGVYGFSVMFNSTPRMCATAGLIGAVANTLRLSLVGYAGMAPEVGALVGALVAGLLASAIHFRRYHGCFQARSSKPGRPAFPRITMTVPSIVIMVPGLYMYRAVYYLCAFDVMNTMNWLMRAAMIVVFLPIGLALARVLTDPRWRYCS
jgi:uncharacterized membrane protein YjjP (DUF1212 family)